MDIAVLPPYVKFEAEAWGIFFPEYTYCLTAVKRSFSFPQAYYLRCICIFGSNNTYSLLSHPNAAPISQVFTEMH